MSLYTAQFRFYAELNDFLPLDKRKGSFPYHFQGNPSIKDAIESLGVPHTEVDLILANGTSVGFDYHLEERDRVSVYPVFESLDISPLIRLRKKPLRDTAFVLDVHLGKLAKLLRMLGFDALNPHDYKDVEIIQLSIKEHRVILTRDCGILKHKSVTHGYWVRSTDPMEQVQKVLRRFDLFSQVQPFARCIRCNGTIDRIDKSAIVSQLPLRTASYYDEFSKCSNCDRIYWKGSHYDRMKEKIARILGKPYPVDPVHPVYQSERGRE